MAKQIFQTITAERAVPGGRRLALQFHDGGERVPGVLLLPGAPAPVPAALLLHGYTSRKEQMSDTIGEALLARGVASLAIDLPLHGERGSDVGPLAVGHPLEVVRRWRQALDEATLALRYLGAHREIDRGHVALVGYSLGSFLAVTLAAREVSVRALALAAGGDLPDATPFSKLVRTVADPLRLIRRLDGRPLLMVNGRWDRVVRPEQATRLYEAAGEPKEIRWWDAGHHLPTAAIAGAAAWIAEAAGAVPVTSRAPS